MTGQTQCLIALEFEALTTANVCTHVTVAMIGHIHFCPCSMTKKVDIAKEKFKKKILISQTIFESINFFAEFFQWIDLSRKYGYWVNHLPLSNVLTLTKSCTMAFKIVRLI